MARKFNNKGRKGYKSSDRPSRSEFMTKSSGGFGNLIKYTGTLSFNNPLGERLLPLNSQNVPGSGVTYSYATTKANGAIPGIMSVDVVPSAGVAYNAASTVNVALNRIYGRTRYENSGASNYENVDEFIYIMCVSSLHLMYYWLRRIYGRLRVFLNWNRYSAPVEMQVHGVDWTDLAAKMPQFAAILDIMKAQVAVFKIPTDFKMINNQIDLYSKVFKDSPLEKAQEIIFRPAGFYKFSLDSSGKGQAEWVAHNYSQLMTLSDIQTMINGFIAPILADNDFNIMSGDIYKAYGTTYELPDCPQDYIVETEYSYETLHALENATILPDVSHFVHTSAPLFDLNVTQDVDAMLNPYIKYSPSFWITSPGTGNSYAMGYEMKSLLNAHDDIPEPGTVANMCRWKIIAAPAVDIGLAEANTILYTINSTGTEFLTNGQIWMFDSTRTFVSLPFYSYMKSGSATSTTILDVEDLISAFNAHPRVVVLERTNYNDWKLHQSFAEIDNYTYVDYDTLNKIQEAYIMDQYSLLDSSGY